MDETRTRAATDAGILDFLARPFSPAGLFRRVAYTIRRRERRMMQHAAAKGRHPCPRTR